VAAPVIGARLKRRLYRGGRPGRLMRVWNRLDAWWFARGPARPPQAAVLEVRGRASGRVRTVPLAVADVGGREHLVSMLGPGAGWVRDVAAAGGRAVLHRGGRRRDVVLEPVPAEERVPVLRRYVAVAPGARPHLGVGPDASDDELRRLAAAVPVFRVVPVEDR
jgi:hypothetical protein